MEAAVADSSCRPGWGRSHLDACASSCFSGSGGRDDDCHLSACRRPKPLSSRFGGRQCFLVWRGSDYRGAVLKIQTGCFQAFFASSLARSGTNLVRRGCARLRCLPDKRPRSFLLALESHTILSEHRIRFIVNVSSTGYRPSPRVAPVNIYQKCQYLVAWENARNRVPRA